MAQFTTTYSGLQTLVQDYVEDTSDEFTSNWQTMLNRAEDRCLNDLDLSIWNKSESTSTADGVDTITKPTGADLIRNVYDATSGTFVQRRPYDYVRMYGGSGAPLYFYEEERGTPKLYLAPTPDGVYSITIRYFERPNRLTASNTTNWLTNNAAWMLLYACLLEAEHFLIDPTRIQEFQSEYGAATNSLRGQYRHLAQRDYEPMQPVATPVQTR